MTDMTQKIVQAVDKHKDLIVNALDYMWENPETGFREWKATRYLEEKYEALGYELTKAGNIPGFYTVIDTGRPGPEILILGELDALLCSGHFHADPETGAAHACGHNAQSAALLGIAAALKEEGMLDGLCGRIRLCAVPAEETGEIPFRQSLKDQGILTHFSGKREFLYRGYFDGVDMAFLVHHLPVDYYSVDGRAVGLISKRATFKGEAAHAGAAPHLGKNALYAATQGLAAINAIRETFQEKDYIRVHPIITEGGSAINTIPDRVTIETYVRGLTLEGIAEANKRVNQALCGSALSMGVELEINDTPGSVPMIDSPKLAAVAGEAIKTLLPDAEFYFFDKVVTGSTDMGDLSALMPTVHPYVPGVSGKGHGNDYRVSDPDLACLMSAKWQLAMLRILLENDGARAKQILSDFKPRFASTAEMFAARAELDTQGDRIAYSDDGIATVTL